MSSAKPKAPRWLTDEQVDAIIGNASADDLIEAMALYPDMAEAPLKVSREIFNRSADRLGLTNGVTAAQMIPASRFVAWTDKLDGLLRADGPKSEATDRSPTSADSGE